MSRRSRAERRADPDQWWRVSGQASEKHVMEIGGDHEVYLKGNVEGATVVQLSPALSRAMGPAVTEAIQESLKGAGIENAIIVPAGVEFLRMEPVSAEEGKRLEHRMALKASALERKQRGVH